MGVDTSSKAGSYDAAIEVLRKLRSAGYEAYFAGGSVRDKLLGRTPEDYDIATAAKPDEVQRLFPRNNVAVGKAFGVIVVMNRSHEIQVATFRSDGAYTDGRHPNSVTFSDLKTDVERRDFTINGMMEDPIEDKVIDLVGGKEDLARRVIRSIGDPEKRFEEDRLRLIRAVRFACQLDFAIDPKLEAAARKMAPLISSVSYERIRVELEKILLTPLREKGIRMLDDWGILKVILPEVTKMKGVEQPPEFHPEGDVFEHTMLALGHLESPDFTLAFATLLHDIGKPDTYQVTDRIRFNEHEYCGEKLADRVCRRFRLSNDETVKIKYLVFKHMIFKDVTKMRQSKLKRLLREPFFPDLKRLCRVDKLAMGAGMEELDFCEAKEREFTVEDLAPKPFLRGQDLLDMGLEPGPEFARLIKAAEDAQLEGELKSKEEAVAFVRKLLAEGGSGI